jgi:hypothetical protein
VGHVIGNMLDSRLGMGIDNTGVGGIKPLNTFNSNKDRMAYARSHRKKESGGSMVPLGKF